MVVLSGISGAIYIIDNSFKAWASNPVITAVEQIPIESVPFPSITICKLTCPPNAMAVNIFVLRLYDYRA